MFNDSITVLIDLGQRVHISPRELRLLLHSLIRYSDQSPNQKTPLEPNRLFYLPEEMKFPKHSEEWNMKAIN